MSVKPVAIHVGADGVQPGGKFAQGKANHLLSAASGRYGDFHHTFTKALLYLNKLTFPVHFHPLNDRLHWDVRLAVVVNNVQLRSVERDVDSASRLLYC